MIWLLIILIAGLTLFLLIAPFLKKGSEVQADGLGAFASQLEELERDRAMELISEIEARTAEAEIKRRWLTAAAQSDISEEGVPSRSYRLAGVGVCAAAVLGAVMLYLQMGSPYLINAEVPQMAEPPEAVQDVLAELESLSQSLIENPDNPEGWYVLAQAYMAMGRYGEAAIAFNNVIDRVEPTAGLFSSLGRAYVFMENGILGPPAREAFLRALELDPEDVMARFFLAEAVLQDGNEMRAIEEWQALRESLPEESEAREMVERRLELLETEGR